MAALLVVMIVAGLAIDIAIAAWYILAAIYHKKILKDGKTVKEIWRDL